MATIRKRNFTKFDYDVWFDVIGLSFQNMSLGEVKDLDCMLWTLIPLLTESKDQEISLPQFRKDYWSEKVGANDSGRSSDNKVGKLKKAPRTEMNGLLREYWYVFAKQKYRYYGYSDTDLRYITEYFRCLVQSRTGINAGDVSPWWKKFFQALLLVAEGKGEKNLFLIADQQRNRDLSILLSRIEHFLQIDIDQKNDEHICNVYAEFFLRLTAIAVMMTEEELPVGLYCLKRYNDYPTLMSEEGTSEIEGFLREKNPLSNQLVQWAKNTLLASSGELLVRFYEWGAYKKPIVDSGYDRNREYGRLVLYFKPFEELYHCLGSSEYLLEIMDRHLREEFFFAVNNPTVQQVVFSNESRFAFLFRLYAEWVHFARLKRMYDLEEDRTNGEYMAQNYMREYDLIDSRTVDRFLNGNEDEVDFEVFTKGYQKKVLKLRRGKERDRHAVNDLNQAADIGVDKYIPSTDGEIEYAIQNGQLYVVEDTENSAIVCCAVIVEGVTEQNKKRYNAVGYCAEKFPGQKIVEFNSIVVRGRYLDTHQKLEGEYTGLGLQRLMLALSRGIAQKVGANKVVSTVSDKNQYSYNNFMRAGYYNYADISFLDKNKKEIQRRLVVLELKG